MFKRLTSEVKKVNCNLSSDTTLQRGCSPRIFDATVAANMGRALCMIASDACRYLGIKPTLKFPLNKRKGEGRYSRYKAIYLQFAGE
jgi:hypothetical protein